MIKNILFDLDGTLLPMDQDVYVRDYAEALAGYFSEYGFEPKQFMSAMMHGVIDSMKNTSDKTNEQIFWEGINAHLGVDLREYSAEMYRFFAEIHPTLCGCVDQGRNSRRPVEILKEKGYRVILATNPVFPRMATYQRMSWAGLSPKDFELVTTYEDSYRSKPNTDYFYEVCERLQLKPEECLMIGNDTRDDMSAASAGMEVWIVTDYLINREETMPENCTSCTFEELIRMAEKMPELIALD